MAQYPPRDSNRTSHGARILAVKPESPADDAGFEPGCYLTSVDGQPLRDIIDWRWLSGEEVIEVGYVDLNGESGAVELWRDQGEEWGFEFDGLVFDGVRQCRNACTFCFMRQLPPSMRPSLYLRDDDFRLSFLVGTFVTLTNMTPEDEARIIEQRISPLRVSLQAVNPIVRQRIIGRHAQRGIESLERLLAAGIEFHAQIVLVPGENDGDVLEETLDWAYEHPGIREIGIVPLGFTRHQSVFKHSFDDLESARAVLDAIRPFQRRAMDERGAPWVYAADEFYRNAWREELLEHVPPASFYGDFEMFEDGIGIIRSTLDDWMFAERNGLIGDAVEALRRMNRKALMVVGLAQREFLDPLVSASGIRDVFQPLYIENGFFGGNVDVTGLLVGQDIINGILGSYGLTPHENANIRAGLRNKEPFSPGADDLRSSFAPGENGCDASPTPSRGSHGGTNAPGANARNHTIAPGENARECSIAPGENALESAIAPGENSTLNAGVRMGDPGEPGLSTEGSDRQFARGEHGRTRSPGVDVTPEPISGANAAPEPLFLLPRVIFNDDGLTLDDMSLHDMEMATGRTLHVVSCTPREYFNEIAALAPSTSARA